MNNVYNWFNPNTSVRFFESCNLLTVNCIRGCFMLTLKNKTIEFFRNCEFCLHLNEFVWFLSSIRIDCCCFSSLKPQPMYIFFYFAALFIFPFLFCDKKAKKILVFNYISSIYSSLLCKVDT